MNRITVDRTALPLLLLPKAKAQARVEHTRDDELITDQLAQAINAVERRCNININPAQYSLLSCELGLWYAHAGSAIRGPLPVNNVLQIVSLAPPGGADQAADYTIVQAEYGGNAAAYLSGPSAFDGDWTLVVDVGMATDTELEPAVTAAILRIAAAYYEARESSSPVFVDDFLSELVSVWRPSA